MMRQNGPGGPRKRYHESAGGAAIRRQSVQSLQRAAVVWRQPMLGWNGSRQKRQRNPAFSKGAASNASGTLGDQTANRSIYPWANRHDTTDVLVIGAGASGGAFTWSLTQAGVKVVCLEQGGWVPLNAFPVSEPQAQLHWQSDFHPNPNFRQLPEDYPVNEDDTPIAPYMYNAVGGSTIHWGSHFPRFHPSDFRLKTLDGVADDWPMDYFELEPYYDQNDRAHGVSGLQGDTAYPPKPARPTPPLPIGPGGELLARAFNKLGWHWWSSDNAVASTAYDGRAADVGEYLRSSSSSDIIFWPGALKQGARLITHARVREILVDETGRATGAAYYDRNGALQVQYARVVVLACNGVRHLAAAAQFQIFPLPQWLG